MSPHFSRRRFICAGSAISFFTLSDVLCLDKRAAAQSNANEEADRIARALTPRVKRGSEVDYSTQRQTIDRLKNVRLRRGGLNLQERDELYEAARPLPQIALEINFALDSAELLPDARPRLDALGQALSRPNLQMNNIVVSGHTDQRGSAEYNLKLSERRASAVVEYLITKFSLDRNKIAVAGYGYERLKNPRDPLAGENRRVEIVNAGRPAS